MKMQQIIFLLALGLLVHNADYVQGEDKYRRGATTKEVCCGKCCGDDTDFSCKESSMTDYSRSKDFCTSAICTKAIIDQVEVELNAAFSYVYLAGIVDDDDVGYSGLAKFLYESASEERSHAILMLDYLDRRGIWYSKRSFSFASTDLRDVLTPEVSKSDYIAILEKVLKMEISVTEKIHNVIDKCKYDYDGADYFTQPILTEQYDGIRKIRAALTSLEDMRDASPAGTNLAEFMLDQKILKNGL